MYLFPHTDSEKSFKCKVLILEIKQITTEIKGFRELVCESLFRCTSPPSSTRPFLSHWWTRLDNSDSIQDAQISLSSETFPLLFWKAHLHPHSTEGMSTVGHPHIFLCGKANCPGNFYPKKIHQTKALHRYSTVLSFLKELNSSFPPRKLILFTDSVKMKHLQVL